MKKHILLTSIVLCVILTSCSRESLAKMVVKTPKINYKNIDGFRSFSDFHKDALYTVAILKQAYPRLYEKIPDFDKKSNQFITNASQSSTEKDFDIVLRKFISILNDGHSVYNINFRKYDKTEYGLALYKEKDHWIISNIDRDIDSVVIGKRIVSINGKPVKEIEEKMKEFECAENEYYKYYNVLLNGYQRFPSYWQAIGVTAKDDRKLTIEVDNSGTMKLFTLWDKELKTIKGYKVKTKKQKFRFAFQQNKGFYDTISKKQNFAYLQMNSCLDYISIKEEIGNYTNFITKPIALNLFIAKDVRNANFGKILQSFFKKIEEQKIENLIIDLSYNTGGDERLGKQLIWYLTDKEPKSFTEYLYNNNYFKTLNKKDFKKYTALHRTKYKTDLPQGEININEKLLNEYYFDNITKENSPFLLDKTIPKFKGQVYVIIGPKTFSAGQMLAATISDNLLATTVGRPLGNKPTTQSGGSAFKLPNTKKIISLSYAFFERPNKSKNHENTLFPDVEIHNSFQDLMNGDNQVMEYILDKIGK